MNKYDILQFIITLFMNKYDIFCLASLYLLYSTSLLGQYTSTMIKLSKWHTFLAMPRHDRKWYRQRFREELAELRQSSHTLDRLSETADVLYALQRSVHDHYPISSSVKTKPAHIVPLIYMMCKYSSRWTFYRFCGWMSGGSSHPISEVMNPAKDSKIRIVAERSNLKNTERFVKIAKGLRRFWPLFP